MNTITLSLNEGIVRITAVCGVTAARYGHRIRTDEPGAASIIIMTNRGNRIESVLHGYHGNELQKQGGYATGAVQTADIIEAAEAGGYNAACSLLWA